MKPLCAETISDLRELLRPETLWERLQGREAPLLGRIARIRLRAEPAAIPYLALAILDRRTAVALAALRTIDEGLRRCAPGEVVQLIDRSRILDPAIAGKRLRAWQGIARRQAERWRGLGASADALFAILAGHGSGYIRQAAVELLAGSQAPYVVPVLRLRLNDWVDPVRRAAAQAIGPLLDGGELATLLGFVPVLEDLRRCGRGNHGPLVDRIRARLAAPAARDLLVDGCTHPDKGVRLWCFLALAASEPTQPFRLDMLAKGDQAMRRHIAKAILAEAKEIDPSPYVELLLADRCMPVRRDGLLALVAWAGPAALERLRGLLADRNATVREFARYYVGRWADAAAIPATLRARLAGAGDGEVAGCIGGLGDVGDAGDIALIAPYRSHRRAAVRRAALLALDRLAPLDHGDPFLAALGDPSPRNRHVAAAALGRRWQQLSADGLLARFFAGDEHERAGVFLAVAHLGALDRLGALLAILAHGTSAFHAHATAQARQLSAGTITGYISVDPAGPTLRRIGSALPRLEPELAARVLAHIRALIREPRWLAADQR
jgi:HEAT repeat protein